MPIVTPAPRLWRFVLPDTLPVGVNHQYAHIPYLAWVKGQPVAKMRKALTAEAKTFRELVQVSAAATGFRYSIKACYALRVTVTYPNWSYDVDGTKLLQDSIFGTRGDHRVVWLDVRKRVVPGVKRLAVAWWEEVDDAD